MKECPFIDTCEDSTSEGNFKSYCQVKFPFSLFINYKHCPTYKRMKVTQQGKKYLQKPREWKKEKEGSKI